MASEAFGYLMLMGIVAALAAGVFLWWYNQPPRRLRRWSRKRAGLREALRMESEE